MRVHFIAIGGSAMHNLAISLKNKGYHVTGSDDEIFEPSKTRLKNAGILPPKMGWNADNISSDIDAVILGMHARKDNPELLKAQEVGLNIYSYPEFLYQQTKNKKRIVIGGSHGKTSITAMALHVLKDNQVSCDYMVGAQLEGFETMVNIEDKNAIAVFEGDEYLSSPIDRRPKFHLYNADIAVISGIAWDHINVFPTFENYVEQFRIFAEQIPETGVLIYCIDDDSVKNLIADSKIICRTIAYSEHENYVENGVTYLVNHSDSIPLQIFGKHNLQNLNAARLVCRELGVGDSRFYKSIQSFKGAARRLECIGKNKHTAVYKDFAHSPSKLKATINAVKQQFPDRKLVACMELHTFSSLNKSFLMEYKGSMNDADVSMVYYNPETIKHKKLAPISISDIKDAFGKDDILVYDKSANVFSMLNSIKWRNTNLLLMTSGNFDGVDLNTVRDKIL
jgi:UDP-N-acetylmuramate: L-alanyl-gamma-D-glutamyl-meso-diaminopimelate ligase